MTALLSLYLCGVLTAQDAAPVFRTTSELVLLDVQVVHNKTKTANGALQAKDFQIAEDGAPQEIAYFDRDRLPLSIVFLFDLTPSVHGVLRRLAGGAQAALAHLKAEDEVAVITYAASANVIGDLTTDRQTTAAAIARAATMKADEAAFFNEAVYQAVATLEKSHNPSSRRVIVWLTDNLPNAPSPSNVARYGKSLAGGRPHTEQEAIRALQEAGTVVTPMLLKDPLAMPWAELAMAFEASDRKRDPAGDARKYAELTGGLAVPMRGKNVEERLAEVLDELRSRYTIGYHPAESKPAGTFCKVHVALSPQAPIRPQDWNVLTRAGYYRK
jgi:VWFA-related protein